MQYTQLHTEYSIRLCRSCNCLIGIYEINIVMPAGLLIYVPADGYLLWEILCLPWHELCDGRLRRTQLFLFLDKLYCHLRVAPAPVDISWPVGSFHGNGVAAEHDYDRRHRWPVRRALLDTKQPNIDAFENLGHGVVPAQTRVCYLCDCSLHPVLPHLQLYSCRQGLQRS